MELDFENSENHEEKIVMLEDTVRFTTSSKFVTHSMLETDKIKLIHKDHIQGRRLVADTCTRSLIFQWMGGMFVQVKQSSRILLKTYLWMLVLVRFDVINIEDFKWQFSLFDT